MIDFEGLLRDDPIKFYSKAHMEAYSNRIYECGGTDEIVIYFRKLVRIADDYGGNESLGDLFFDACRKFDFSRPYEDDGLKRWFRRGDTPDRESTTGASEQSYRRGFHQGFAKALQMVDGNYSKKELEEYDRNLRFWRLRKLFSIGVWPVNEESIDDGVLLQRSRSNIAPTLRFKIMQRDQFRCKYCGATTDDNAKLEIDHIVPVSKGGDNDPENLQTLCFECNRGKRDHLV